MRNYLQRSSSWWVLLMLSEWFSAGIGRTADLGGVSITVEDDEIIAGKPMFLHSQAEWRNLACGTSQRVWGAILLGYRKIILPAGELMPHFVRDVEEIRRRAINKMEDGAVTESYKGDVNKTVEILNEALATEIVCVLRYMHHYFMATGVHAKGVADEFKEHADDEREHADSLAERIQQLGGKPNFDPKGLLERSVSQYVEGETLAEMIREDLIAERMVIEVYQEMVRYFGSNDPTTRTLVEELLRKEEEYASDLSDLLYIANPETGKSEGEDPGADPLKLEESGKTRERSEEELKKGRSKKPAA